MSNDAALRQLERKAIGFSAGAIRVFGKDAVEPGGLNYVIRSVEQTAQGVLKLSLAMRPEEGQPDAPHVQLAIDDPGELKIGKDSIEVATARYVRFEELIAIDDKAGARLIVTGRDRGHAQPGAPALVLLRG